MAFPLTFQVGTPDYKEDAGVTAEPSAVWSVLTPSATTGPQCPLSTRPGAAWGWLWWEEWSMPLEVTAEICLLSYMNTRELMHGDFQNYYSCKWF